MEFRASSSEFFRHVTRPLYHLTHPPFYPRRVRKFSSYAFVEITSKTDARPCVLDANRELTGVGKYIGHVGAVRKDVSTKLEGKVSSFFASVVRSVGRPAGRAVGR